MNLRVLEASSPDEVVQGLRGIKNTRVAGFDPMRRLASEFALLARAAVNGRA